MPCWQGPTSHGLHTLATDITQPHLKCKPFEDWLRREKTRMEDNRKQEVYWESPYFYYYKGKQKTHCPESRTRCARSSFWQKYVGSKVRRLGSEEDKVIWKGMCGVWSGGNNLRTWAEFFGLEDRIVIPLHTHIQRSFFRKIIRVYCEYYATHINILWPNAEMLMLNWTVSMQELFL